MERARRGRELLPRWILGSLLLILTLFAFSPNANAAVTGKIAGAVVNAETGNPLPGANIIVEGTEMGAACDVDGYFFIINIPPGEYNLQARMIGYKIVTQTGVRVSTDHTTNIKFELETTVVEGEGVTIQAQREVIKMDLSSSREVAWAEEIQATPLVTDIREYVNMQAGVQDWRIREGDPNQTKFIVDGLMMVDNRLGRVLLTPNLSSIKEVSIVKGGFNAEYGMVRSGLINVVTKEGSPEAYHGSINFRFTPAHLKHSGYSLFDHNNYYLYPYLSTEDSVCWIGTDAAWLDSTRSSYDTIKARTYPSFRGWLAASAAHLDSVSPEDLRDVFIFQHACEGSGELGQNERQYGHRPDWLVDGGFGGPLIPGFKDLTFFVSHRTNKEMFRWPTSRDYYQENNTQLKLTYRLNQSIKVGVTGIYKQINTVDKYPMDDEYDAVGAWDPNEHFASSATDVEFTTGAQFYWPVAVNPFDVYIKAAGFSLDHSLSPNTFYSVRITRQETENQGLGPIDLRDTTWIANIGGYKVTELPYGWWSWGQNRRWESIEDQMQFNCTSGSNMRDESRMTGWNLKADLTSQINRYNQIKMGVEYNEERVNTYWGFLIGEIWSDPAARYPARLDMGIDSIQSMTGAWIRDWNQNPYRIEAYVQDKIEFQGMIANLGLRLMYFNPNTDWYDILDPFSEYFEEDYKYIFTDSVPTVPAASKMVLSPRIGISHPISEVSKLYFNYGYFYSLAPLADLYTIGYGATGNGITFLGNPEAEFPRTVSYEIGYDHQIGQQFLLRISAYYKDITNQISQDSVTNITRTVDYVTVTSRNYEDIRGFEVGLRKMTGAWITGWANYTYNVSSSGNTGREHYYEPRDLGNRDKGMSDPEQDKNLPRPRFNTKLSITSPTYYGTLLGDWRLSFYSTWEAGEYTSYDPLDIGTYEFRNNLQWKAYKRLDLQVSKSVRFGSSSLELFMDVYNLFDWKHINLGGFLGSTDLDDETADIGDYEGYLESLHLPMYGDDKYSDNYEAEGRTAGNDQLGDINSDSKPYINMPNLAFRTFLEPRTVTFGVRLSF